MPLAKLHRVSQDRKTCLLEARTARAARPVVQNASILPKHLGANPVNRRRSTAEAGGIAKIANRVTTGDVGSACHAAGQTGDSRWVKPLNSRRSRSQGRDSGSVAALPQRHFSTLPVLQPYIRRFVRDPSERHVETFCDAAKFMFTSALQRSMKTITLAPRQGFDSFGRPFYGGNNHQRRGA